MVLRESEVEIGTAASEEMPRRLNEKLGQGGLRPHGNWNYKIAAGWYELSLQQWWEAAEPRW
jgi:hypothetical protein